MKIKITHKQIQQVEKLIDKLEDRQSVIQCYNNSVAGIGNGDPFSEDDHIKELEKEISDMSHDFAWSLYKIIREERKKETL